ncbi:DUF3530 family protein [Litorilituus lipolyticus]|nr:DUF3530 family protein [Litorilituus lipolyticus]
MQLKHIIFVSLFSFMPLFAMAEQQEPAKSEQTTEQKSEQETSNPAQEKSSSTQTKKSNQPLPIKELDLQKQDLKHYLSKERISPLLVGPTEYVTLIKNYSSANSKGVAILLPDWQQGATNPKAINYLANTLPEHGWTTITIQPDNKPDNYPSIAINTTEQKKANEEIISTYKNDFSLLIKAVMAKAKEYPGIVIIVSQGMHSTLLIDMFSQENSEPANALILLSSYFDTSAEFAFEENKRFAHQLAMSEYPVLDLFLKNDHPKAITYAKQRKSITEQEMKVYYRQRQLNNTVTGYYPEVELLSQIHSWLRAVGW